jgi:hypothetical protein
LLCRSKIERAPWDKAQKRDEDSANVEKSKVFRDRMALVAPKIGWAMEPPREGGAVKDAAVAMAAVVLEVFTI